MNGLMMDMPLLLANFLQHAATAHRDQEIVDRAGTGEIFRYTYADANTRALRLAAALDDAGIAQGERIATLAWNSHRHFEMFYGVSGSGRVLHTINPRLHRDQLVYIINHCEDSWLFCDPETLELAEDLASDLPSVEGYCLLCEPEDMPGNSSLAGLVCYEELIGQQKPNNTWPAFDENRASSICYTSGTTGNPKGVVYSHRAMVLATLTLGLRDFLGYTQNGHLDVFGALAPMFHGNAWNLPYLAPALGMKLVLPGRDYSPEALVDLLRRERVTIACGVPTLWMLILEYLENNGESLPEMKAGLSAGATPPAWLVERYFRDHGIDILNTWGGTEFLVASTGSLKPGHDGEEESRRFELQQRSGRPHWGVQLRAVDDEGKPVPADGVTFGHLQAKGPFVARAYYRRGDLSPVRDGWFDTGDVVIFDEEGYFRVVDRSKDVIKSGGEWISSVDLENHALAHADIASAAVIAVSHPRWQERPLLVCALRSGSKLAAAEIMEFLKNRVAKWWLPDAIEFMDAIPLTATGKVRKLDVREVMQQRGYEVLSR